MLRLISETYPRNITLSQEQYKEIYPDKVPMRITYLFGKKKGITIGMPDEIAMYIVKHFGVKIIDDDNKVLDIKDELDTMHWKDLQKLGREYGNIAGTKNEMWQLKRPQIIAKIRKWRKDGVKL